MRFLKELLDHFVFHVIFVISIILAFVELSIIPQSWQGDWTLWLLLVVWVANVAILAWFWKRYGPTREVEEEAQEISEDIFE